MKFFNLLKKELAELINMQTILSIVVSLLMFVILGNVMSDTMEEAIKQEYTLNIADHDNTDFTANLIDRLREYGAEVKLYDADGEYADILASTGQESIIILPEGFSDKVESGESPEVISVEGMKSSAVMSNLNDNSSALSLISSCISEIFAENFGISADDIKIINNPISVSENTVVGNESAQAGKSDIMNQLMTKSMILPIIVFMLIVMTSQTLISAISNEKIDKTLETLLSAPVSRISILTAKMLATSIVALLQAVVFMVGFSFFMSGATESAGEIASTMVGQVMPVDEAMQKLGLVLNGADYILIGVQMFFTVMICLSISLMLGVLVTDTKQSQTVVMPLLFGAMIPYMISMFADINTLPIVIRIIVYAIPFTHTFSGMSNIMFGNMAVFWGGLAYQAVAFVVCLFCAVKLFNSDKILTASLNFGQKSKTKKNMGAEE
ncbi:MAG: ABC transporter permease [Ruminococcus sp.]|nr:ABC transporter permease [Ruminococcus sp.]